MRGDHDPAVRATIEACREALEEGIAFMGATALGELFEAEAEDVISERWRRFVDVAALEELVARNSAEIVDEWRQDFEHLDRMLSFGPIDTGEEALLVLMLRSDLERTKQHLEPEAARALQSLDEALRAELRENRDVYLRESKRRMRASLAKRLPGHWWWRP